MYDNPDVMLEPMPDYPKGGVEPTGGQLVPDYTVLRLLSKDRHPVTGEELDLIN